MSVVSDCRVTCPATASDSDSSSSQWARNFEEKIKDLAPTEQEAVRKFWRSVVMRNAPRVFSDENGRLPQCSTTTTVAAANVRSCNCCPYGYHIDLDFVRYCEALANAKPSAEELQRRSRRRSRKSMEFMLGLDGLFEQWDAAARVQAVPEASHESDSPDSPRPTLISSTPYSHRPRSSSVPRLTYGSLQRPESPFGTASSTCSSLRGAESDAPYSMLRQRHQLANSPPATRAFLRDALDEVCSDFERTLERTSMRRKKPNGVNGMMSFSMGSDRNNNNYGLRNGFSCSEKRQCYTWERYYDTIDSCVTGNKSPRSSRYLSKTNSLPYQTKLSPAEQQYESYVQATVAANAKSPVEDVPTSPPPPPPPRRHALQAKIILSPKTDSTEDSYKSALSEVQAAVAELNNAAPQPKAQPPVTTGGELSASTDAQTLFNIRQQMALSLKRMKDLEEQVKAIPELQHELTQLRDEKERLQSSLQRKDEELLRAREHTRTASSTPSPPSGSPKLSSPVQFTPQRISPVSLESLGARLRSNSSSSERQLRSLKRDVGTMCGLHGTRDIAVGSPVISVRTVGTNPAAQLLSIQEMLYTQLEMEEHIQVAIRKYEEQRSVQQLKKLISVGTQMFVPRFELRDSGVQTSAELVRKCAVGVTAKPTTRDTHSQVRPETRTIGCSEDRVLDELCLKCRIAKRNVACGTEDKAFEQVKSVSLKLLDRSKTFSLGDNERLNIIRKSTGTQYQPVAFNSSATQTVLAMLQSVGVQVAAELQHAGTQSAIVERAHKQTDTKQLIRLCATQTSTDEISTPRTPTPPVKEIPKAAVEPTMAPVPLHTPLVKPQMKSTSSNTEPPPKMQDNGVNTLVREEESLKTKKATVRNMSSNTEAPPKMKDYGVNTLPQKEEKAPETKKTETRSMACNTEAIKPIEKKSMSTSAKPDTRSMSSNTDAPPKTKEHGVNTLPPAAIRHSGSNTETIRKRDIGCGDIVKPHISIACADNYCDSCKDAIKHLAKDFSTTKTATTPPSPLPVRATDSKIPRPKHLSSPSPVRKQFQRQNTYTITPSPTPSPIAEKKTMSSSLHEKPPLASFHSLESSGESQSFITEPTSAQKAGARRSSNASVKRAEELESVFTPETPNKERAPLKATAGDLIVREETRVRISWSRDASPAPGSSPFRSLDHSYNEKLKEQQESSSTKRAEETLATAAELLQGARKKTSPVKSSQSEYVETLRVIEGNDEAPQQPQEDGGCTSTIAEEAEAETKQSAAPSKALLQKLAMVEAEPRQKFTPPEDMLCALKIINESLLKKVGAKPFSSSSLKSAKMTIQQDWFRVSSMEKANPHEVEDYLDCFEALSVPLLEYCVNMMDTNGNTAMHYAVSHGNFDVVSILLDSKVCNVNQMNNAGYTSVMLVSLAKIKNTAHRTVVERLFQMADVNIRAKKHCQTALMLAVSHGNLNMVELLLAAGADINIQDEDGSTALMCAAEHGRADIVKLLLSQADCDSLIQDVDGSTAFKIAWQAGHRDIGLLLYVHEQMLRSRMPNREPPRTPLSSPKHQKPAP